MRPHAILSPKRPSRRLFLSAVLPVLAISILPRAALAAPPIITAPDAYKAVQNRSMIMVDIRTPQEWLQTGVARGAVAIDMRADDFIGKLARIRSQNPDKPIAMICATGHRSTYVTGVLDQRGFPGLVNVAEGMVGGADGTGWLKRGLPVYPGQKTEIDARLNALLNAGQ